MGKDTGEFAELPALLATCHQDIGIDFPGWGLTVDYLLRKRSPAQIKVAVAELDDLLAAGLSSSALRDTVWSLGASALPNKDPVVALRGLREHLVLAIEARANELLN